MKCPHCDSECRPGGKTCWEHLPGPASSGEGDWRGTRWQGQRNKGVGAARAIGRQREEKARAEGRVV